MIDLSVEATGSRQATSLEGAFTFARLSALMAATAGRPEVVVAVIDGPAQWTHPDLAGARLRVIPDSPPDATATSRADGPSACTLPTSTACRHGTFVLGLLAAGRDSATPGIAPGCTVMLRQVLCEAGPGRTCPTVTPTDLATAIVETVDNGARIINLSLGVGAALLARSGTLHTAIDHAFRRGVLVVSAAGNHGLIGPVPLLAHPWLVPVAACDLTGRPLPSSNLGPTIGRSGLLAPGAAIAGLAPDGHQRLTGTSAAAPFVTGTAALLWSLRPDLTAAQLRSALLRPGVARRSIVPPRLDAEASWRSVGGG